MAQLYRKAALERISSPEQLDQALKVTSPMSWVALAAATFAIVVVIVWSVVGKLPITVSANGIIASPVSTNALYTSESGKATSVMVFPGAELHIGDPVLTYRTGNGDVHTLLSDQVGTVTNVTVKTGDEITQGNEVARISPKVAADQVVVCYLPLADAKKIERGITANIYLTSAESQTYGHMEARIVNVDSYVSSAEGMSYVLGKDNNLAAAFQQDGAAVVAVTCELYPAKEGQESVSGYFWSNERGRQVEVTNGSLVSAKIVTKEIPPIAKLFGSLKQLWGE